MINNITFLLGTILFCPQKMGIQFRSIFAFRFEFCCFGWKIACFAV